MTNPTKAGEKLERLLEKRKTTISQFAREAGVPRLTISRLVNKSRNGAKRSNIQKLIEATGGYLKFSDFLE